MESPQIFLHQEHVEDLLQEHRRQGGIAERWALGLALDDDDVFHVYTAPPQTHFSGRPCRAVVLFAEGRLRDEWVAATAEALRRSGQAEIVVALGVEDGAVAARGLVMAGPRAGEGTIRFVPLRSELYSRSRGLLETDALAQRTVAVVGLGSGGSGIAVALAQAGVGRIVLVDRDRLEVANIARHVCGVGDLGRYKTRSVRDMLFGKNPYLQVETHEIDIVADPQALRRAVAGADLLIAATDGDRSRFVLNQLALDLGRTAIFGRALTRAAGGDVLRVRPFAGPCLACVYTEQFLKQRQREYSNLREVREDLPAYTAEETLDSVVQVGLASDIAPISNLMVKLALIDLLGGGLSSLAEDLQADLYVWANRRDGDLPP